MTVTDEFNLPTPEELTVQEINMSAPYLRAGAVYFGKHCDEQSKEFMLCKKEYPDPRKCLTEGKEVTSCALDFFRKVKKSCAESFTAYGKCLDYSSAKLDFAPCRKSQASFDMCMLEKLEMERPELGYFSKPRVHDSARPRPPVAKPFREFKTRDELPDDFPREEFKAYPLLM